MLLVHYTSRGQLERAVGEKLKFWDNPSRGDDDYSPNGKLEVSNGPGRLNFQATVYMRDGLIDRVEFPTAI
jgi:hypothetical protein